MVKGTGNEATLDGIFNQKYDSAQRICLGHWMMV